MDMAMEEARERGHEEVVPAHLALAVTRNEGEAWELIRRAAAEPRQWRDYINYILGLNDGYEGAESGRVRSGHLRDIAELRYTGELGWSRPVLAVLEAALAIADGDFVDHRHLLAAFFEGHGGIAAGTARFVRLDAGRLRRAAGLPGPSRLVLPEERSSPRPKGRGSVLLLGSCHLDEAALRVAVGLTAPSKGAVGVVIEAATGDTDASPATELSDLTGFKFSDSGLLTRADAYNPGVVTSLLQAGCIWIDGGDVLRLYSALVGTPALQALVEASDSGSLIIGCSAGAQVLGHGCLAASEADDREEPVELLGWLDRVIVRPHCSGEAEQKALRRAVVAFPGSVGLGVAHRGAVLLRGGWRTVEAIRKGWDGGNVLLHGPELQPKWLRDGPVVLTP
jgi:Peptidase family S51/Clp amino terminal domain, pathogenicity island component